MPEEDAVNDNMWRELRESRQRLETLFEFNPNGVFVVDRDGRFKALNPACERIMGYSAAELIGRPFQEVTAPESLQAAQQGFIAAMRGESIRTRVVGYARDGSARHLDMAIAPVLGDDGIDGVIVMAHDVTKRLLAEQQRDAIEAELRAREERYQAFISQSSEAIWRFELEQPVSCELDADAQIDLYYKYGYLAECNDAMAHMYGYKRAGDIVGLRLGDTLPDTPENREYLRGFVESGYRVVDAESKEIDAHGNVCYFSNNFVGTIENGYLLRAWGTQRDITQRRRIEAEVRSNEERYQVFIAQSSEAIWRYEIDTPIPIDLPVEEQFELLYRHSWLAECNDALAQIYGFDKAADAIGRRLSELLPRKPRTDEYLRNFIASNWRLTNVESSRIERDGRAHYYLSNLLGIIEDGCVVRTWGTRRDITERKEMELALRESEERLDLAVKSGDLGTWDWDLATGAMSCSPLTRQLLGLEEDDPSAIQIDIQETYRKFETAIYPQAAGQLLSSEGAGAAIDLPLEIEHRVVWPDGSVHWLAVVGRLVHTPEDIPRRMIGTCRDITLRKQRELHQSIIAEASEQLASSLDLDTTLNSIAHLLVPTHADWCVIDLLDDALGEEEAGSPVHANGFNGNGHNGNGHGGDGHYGNGHAVTGRRVAVAHRDRYKEQFLWHMKALAGGDDPFCLTSGDEAKPLLVSQITAEQQEELWPDPTQRALMQAAGMRSIMCVPLRARDRTLGALILASSRIDRRYQTEDLVLAKDIARRAALAVDNARLYGQAEAARRDAEAANRAKDEFLAVVSHELRTPLTPLLGWIDLLNAGRLDDDQRSRALEAIGRNAHAQLQLVNDLLDVSRMISGKLPLEPQLLDWRDPVDTAVENVLPTAIDRNVEIAWRMPERVVPVSGDPMRLRQVAINLLTNAVKFTPSGGRIEVELIANGNGQASHSPAAQFVVRDNGIGIAQEFLPHVWDRFRQADTTTTRRFGGLGLGLAIVRHIVHAHGGDVQVSSEGAGQGTTFSITLPLAVPEAADTPVVQLDSAAVTGAGRQGTIVNGSPDKDSPDAVLSKSAQANVLLIDDEADARELFTAMLTDAGWDTRSAGSCEEALELMESGKWRPDIIVSDLALPGMDGYAFLQRLASSPWAGIPAIALTAYARDEDRRRALQAGFALHLAKPAPVADLCHAVAETLQTK